MTKEKYDKPAAKSTSDHHELEKIEQLWQFHFEPQRKVREGAGNQLSSRKWGVSQD